MQRKPAGYLTLIWKPVAEVEQRVGYTIEQINHMRDVFGTRLRRAEDAFPPVIGVAAHKGGFTKPPFLFT
ncbi:plasmid-partitioning protein SopA [Klebsiella pneumoniae]|nr:plasmid-partitioning protein SopA [Klebsiella pneumoniae]